MPLTFDLPLEELKTYQGRTPRPADFDTYWDGALAEMHSLDPKIELVPADFQTPYAECFHLYFTGVGGARVHAKLVRPKSAAAPHPAVVHFHGYTGRIGDWAEEMKLAWAAAGFTYAGLDCRGQGGRSEDVGGVAGNTHRGHIIRGLAEAVDGRPEQLLYRQIFLDTAQLARIVMEMEDVDETRVGAWGASQGGALTVACSALEPRVKQLAPVFPFLSDYKRVWAMDQAKDAYAELHEWFRRYDPLHEREDDVFNALGYIDIQHLAPRIQGKTLWTIGLMDTICPPSTQFAAYNKITSHKSMRIYPDYRHEAYPGTPDAIFQYMMEL
ncbi:MAG: acetylxylan esterase [Chloroflexota bacterium]